MQASQRPHVASMIVSSTLYDLGREIVRGAHVRVRLRAGGEDAREAEVAEFDDENVGVVAGGAAG